MFTRNSKYQMLKRLNNGAFGVVVLAQDIETNELVAVKFLERGDRITKYVEREILNHRLLNHPHVIELKEVFITEQHLAIVLEYADCGDMFDFVVRNNGLEENAARWYFQQLIIALDYCHTQFGIVNRDIKLENALLCGRATPGSVPLLKLCDFGYSKREKVDSAPGSRVGTPAYLAPEVILNRQAGQTFDGRKSDIWACGVMLYVMLCGAYPFERAADRDDPKRASRMIQNILRVEYSDPPDVSPDCIHLLRAIFVADVSKRMSMEQLKTHPWFMKNLPAGVAQMNQVRRAPSCRQSEEAIRAIVKDAMQVPGSQLRYFDDELDTYRPQDD